MVQTRTAGRTAPGRTAPPRTKASQSTRTSLPRRSKPTTALVTDSTTDGEDDVSIESDSVNDVSDDDDSEAGLVKDDIDLEIDPGQPTVPRKNTRTRQSRRKSSSGVKRRGRPSKQLGRSVAKRRKIRPTEVETEIPTGIIPAWTSPLIPFSIWADIFYYAETSNSWLIHTATTCKAFCDPALTVLYRDLDLTATMSGKVKKLLALLELPPEETLLNYRVKIESLFVGIETIPLAILPKLIRPLPRLRDLMIRTVLDDPPYRSLDMSIRWRYPEELIHSLFSATESPEFGDDKPHPTILRHWEWSSRLLGGYVSGVEDLSRVHQLPSFSQLQSLSLVNFQVPSLSIEVKGEEANMELLLEDQARATAVAESISQLKHLKRLRFESSTLVNDYFLPLLPKNLEQLALICCWEVQSDDLSSFLRTHGRQLRILRLDHDQSLNLEFLTTLAETCPNLQELSMNMTYYRIHTYVADDDPNYNFALLPDQKPQWPRSLRVLNIENIRQLSVEACEMFLQSLIDAAPNLPDLRRINIKAVLTIPWQARAQLRVEWNDKFETVFLRLFEPPKHHTTIHELPTTFAEGVQPKRGKKKRHSSPSRRSGRIAAHTSDSDRNNTRGSSRRSAKPMYHVPDTDEDDLSESESEQSDAEKKNDGESQDESKDDAKPFIQGRCHEINILFDNQKVREQQFGIADFQDDMEVSSGEEWNGDEEFDDTVFVFR